MAKSKSSQAMGGQPEASFRLAVFAYKGTEDLVSALWKRFCSEPFIIVSQPENANIKTTLEEAFLNPYITKEFVLIPANFVPVGKVSFAELCCTYVMTGRNGEYYYNLRLPLSIDKEKMAAFLPENDALSDGDFIAKWVKETGSRPLEVSFFFGNFITPVLRGNPCRNVVIEALVRKKFVCANLAGWSAIEDLLQKLIEK